MASVMAEAVRAWCCFFPWRHKASPCVTTPVVMAGGGGGLELAEMEVGVGEVWRGLDSGEHADMPELSNYTFSAEGSSCLIRHFSVPH